MIFDVVFDGICSFARSCRFVQDPMCHLCTLWHFFCSGLIIFSFFVVGGSFYNIAMYSGLNLYDSIDFYPHSIRFYIDFYISTF